MESHCWKIFSHRKAMRGKEEVSEVERIEIFLKEFPLKTLRVSSERKIAALVPSSLGWKSLSEEA